MNRKVYHKLEELAKFAHEEGEETTTLVLMALLGSARYGTVDQFAKLTKRYLGEQAARSLLSTAPQTKEYRYLFQPDERYY